MLKSHKISLSNKWKRVLEEYERIKKKEHPTLRTVNDLCSVFKIHRKDIRKYYERWMKSGKSDDSLLPQKRGPKPGRMKLLSKEDERLIISIRRRLHANENEIAHLIKGYFEIPPSVSTIYRTFKRYPLNEKRKETVKRYEKRYPGELVHADTYQLSKTVVIERKKYYLMGVIDDCTRLCYVELINSASASEAVGAFIRAYKWFDAHGFHPEKVMTDNGTEFTSYTSSRKQEHFFETMLAFFGVKHSYTKPYRPQTNGKIERFWKILNQECIRTINETITKEELTAEINGFMYRYNYQRKHGGLKYITPLDKLKNIADLLPKL
jgi:transposase InsO family protein